MGLGSLGMKIMERISLMVAYRHTDPPFEQRIWSTVHLRKGGYATKL